MVDTGKKPIAFAISLPKYTYLYCVVVESHARKDGNQSLSVDGDE
jgi:hypothetical protein